MSTTSTDTTYNEEQARKNIQLFYDPLELPGGYSWNHVDTLKMIDLYYNSKYKTGSYDNLGLRKFFYNIVKPTCDIATKFIDLDTKDILLMSEHADDEFRVWIMQKRLKQWLKDTNFGALLNDITFNLPKYGTVVIKKTYDDEDNYEWKRVNIQNLRMNPTVECLDYSEFVYEHISMSRSQIQKMKWDSGAIQELFDRSNDQMYVIYECYDKTEKGFHRTIRADLFSTKRKNGAINRSIETEINELSRDYYGGIILYEDDVDELPYREMHWEKSAGRWLGYGFVEYLEENQIALNEAENLERKGLIFTALKLWQTRDETVGGLNILSAAQNGDILKVESEITPINMSTGAELNAFNNTRNNWTANTERKTFSTDITTGANLPSRTPLGVANLQASLATSYFDLKRENLGLFLKELVLEDILPDFQNDNRSAHILTFLGTDQDIEKLDNIIVKVHVDNAVLQYALTNGYFPSQQDRDRVKGQVIDQLRKNRNRYLDVPKDFYVNARYAVDVNITGESVDNGTKSQVLQLAMQILSTNPAILQSPVTKNIFFSLLNLGGISPVEIGLTDAVQNQAQQGQQGQQPPLGGAPGAPQQGGSIALPTANKGGFATEIKTY